eukprot:12077260-Alexandrium_andersonii.AAC.1
MVTVIASLARRQGTTWASCSPVSIQRRSSGASCSATNAPSSTGQAFTCPIVYANCCPISGHAL